MEIDTKINTTGVNNLTPARRSVAAAPSAAPDSSFASSSALEAALKNTPDVRASEVDRARELISDPNYPSSGTINQLAGFLADKLTSTSE
jgi:hypothetical protein